MMTHREWIQAVLAGEKDLPIGQHWMSFFNGQTACELVPADCHYERMWIFDAGEEFDFSSQGAANLDRLIRFNETTGRCFACLGQGANVSFGHGGPGEFALRQVERNDNEIILEHETGVKVHVRHRPHFLHYYDHPVSRREDLKGLKLPDPADPLRYAGFAKDAAYLKSKGEYVVGSLNGFFSGIHYFFMDYEKTFMALAAEGDFIHELLEILGRWNLEAAKQMIDHGADCIALCDDLGSKHSLMFSPKTYREFFKGWHSKLCELAHEKNAQVHLHSHGAIWSLLDDLSECGFDFVNPFDPEEGFEMESVLKTYSDRFVVVGGFPAGFWKLSPDQQEKHLESLGRLGKTYGRLIFMDSGGIPEDVRLDNFNRVLEVSRRVRGVEGISGAV